mgnify:FL=1
MKKPIYLSQTDIKQTLWSPYQAGIKSSHYFINHTIYIVFKSNNGSRELIKLPIATKWFVIITTHERAILSPNLDKT